VRVRIEVKSDSAGSDACDSKCNWSGLSLFIPEDVTALDAVSITTVARPLNALSRNSAKDLAPTSTHCDYN